MLCMCCIQEYKQLIPKIKTKYVVGSMKCSFILLITKDESTENYRHYKDYKKRYLYCGLHSKFQHGLHSFYRWQRATRIPVGSYNLFFSLFTIMDSLINRSRLFLLSRFMKSACRYMMSWNTLIPLLGLSTWLNSTLCVVLYYTKLNMLSWPYGYYHGLIYLYEL